MTTVTKDSALGDTRETPTDVRPQDGAPADGRRIASVDALRGLTILLMVFVNDLGRPPPPGCTTSSRPEPTA